MRITFEEKGGVYIATFQDAYGGMTGTSRVSQEHALLRLGACLQAGGLDGIVSRTDELEIEGAGMWPDTDHLEKPE
jgi:hypothetical protein